MNEIATQKQHLRIMSAIVFTIITIIACLLGIWAVERRIIKPINKLSNTANEYSANDLKFSKLDIHTGDEIETLANSIKRMEQETKEYYENLIATRNDLQTARKNAENYKREANIDSLTKLRNKRAYDLTIADLENSSEPYAIAMIDLNDLKGINDKYGHDKGDTAIKNLSKLICKIFKHSPVFRIGGDEFVVVLTNGDLDAREGLIGHFRDEVRKSTKNTDLQPWERISAACGYAVYDERIDRNALSVFKRADEDMYEHKIKMKKAGK
jgi:diguanylate cyclase (GGDEF)-like protein